MIYQNKQKPKIAVCFFGHLRTYKKCAPYLKKNLLNYYDADLFIHTWDQLDYDHKSWHGSAKVKGKTYERRLIETYGKFKKILIEKQVLEDLGSHNNHFISGMKCAYLTRYKSCKLAQEYAEQNNIKYDYVLLIRPDLMVKVPVIIEDLISDDIKNIDNTVFCVMTCFVGSVRVCTDIFFLAKSDVMFKFMDATDYAIEQLIIDKWRHEDPENFNSPEDFIYFQAQKTGIDFAYPNKLRAIDDWCLERLNSRPTFMQKHYNSIVKRYRKLKEFMKVIKC